MFVYIIFETGPHCVAQVVLEQILFPKCWDYRQRVQMVGISSLLFSSVSLVKVTVSTQMLMYSLATPS